VLGCSTVAPIDAEPLPDASVDPSGGSAGKAQDAAPTGGSGGTVPGAGGVGGAAGQPAESGAPDASPDAGLDSAAPDDAGDSIPDADPVDASPEVSLPCDWAARFAKCQALYPAGAAIVQQCVCNCGYQGCPTCEPTSVCGDSFCNSASTGTGVCMSCLEWFFQNYASKCPSGGSAFVQCVTVPKNC